MRRRTTLTALVTAGLLLTSTPAHAAPDFADVLAATIDSDVPSAHRIDPWAVPLDEAEPRPIDGWARPDVISPARLAVLRLERIRAEERRAAREAASDIAVNTISSDVTPVMPVGAIQELICSYAWECSIALRVAGCESGFSPTAVNGSHLGLFQREGETSTDPEVQVRNAYAMYQERGWQPWGLGESWGCAF